MATRHRWDLSALPLLLLAGCVALTEENLKFRQGSGVEGEGEGEGEGDSADTDCPDGSAPGSWYADADGDGYGDPDALTMACDQPDGTSGDSDDCDDTDPAVSPEGTEICGGADEDCDGETDEAGAEGESTWYADGDGDGYGDDETTSLSCSQPDGYVAGGGDCDDTREGACAALREGPFNLTAETTGDGVLLLEGIATDDLAGTSVAAGDWDLDGHADLAVGASQADQVYVLSAPDPNDADISLDDAVHVDHTSNSPFGDGGYYGTRVAWVGDLDMDDYSYPELAVSAVYAAGFGGAVQILQGPDGSSAFNIQGSGASDGLGTGQGYGDLNGDDQQDIVLGSPDLNLSIGAGLHEGRTYVLLGPISSGGAVTSLAGATIDGSITDYGSGAALGVVGDTDGGGVDDLIVGAYGASPLGAAYLFRDLFVGYIDPVSISTEDADITLHAETGYYGGTLARGAGDVNNDGQADFMVSSVTGSDSGSVYLFSGGISSSGTFESLYTVRFDGLYDGAALGYGAETAVSAGDVNGDDYDDLWIAAIDDTLVGSDTTKGPGRVYLVLGGGEDFSGVQSLAEAQVTFIGESYGDCTGNSVAPAGDVNGDGCVDLIAGATQLKRDSEPRIGPGHAWLISGCTP